MDFAFLIHSRTTDDVARKFPLAKYLPKKIIELWCLLWPPVIVSKITGLKSKNGQEVKGWLVGVPMTAKQMLQNRKTAQKRVVQAIKKAEKLGAKIVGLGALTASITQGGKTLLNDVKTNITTGNALTTAISLEHLKQIIHKKDLGKKALTIAVLGATGSIGQALSILIAKNSLCSNLLVFGRTQEHMEELSDRISTLNNTSVKINKFLNNLNPINKADIILVATASDKAILKSEHLKKGAIVYDITQPQNISEEIRAQRTDVWAIDGGLVKINNLEKRFPLGMGKNKIFACLAETITLALENRNENYAISNFDYKKAEEIILLAEKNNIRPNNIWT